MEAGGREEEESGGAGGCEVCRRPRLLRSEKYVDEAWSVEERGNKERTEK